MQYGQFVEYLCDLVPAMWAEKLWDGSFEGLSPYNFVFLQETDFKQKPWYPSGEVNRAQVALDTNTVVSGAASKTITIEAGAPATAGISQDGIFVERGQPCNLTIWLRARGVNPPSACGCITRPKSMPPASSNRARNGRSSRPGSCPQPRM
jgi:hypothetical protein